MSFLCIFTGGIHHTFLYDVDSPISMAIVGDDLFWSSTKRLKLSWTPKHSFVGTKSMNIEHPDSAFTPTKVEILAISQKSIPKHPCALHGNNGECSHVCVAMGKSTSACLCSPGTVFQDAANTTCVPHQDCYFRCGSGECISEIQRCNGNKDCQDFSDEEGCQQKKKYVTCGPDEFTCLDRLKCIDRKHRFVITFEEFY